MESICGCDCWNLKSKTMNNKKNDKETLASKYGLLFLAVLAVFFIVFCFMLCHANREFHRSQESIKQTYANHIQKADSLYFDMISYNKNYISIFTEGDVLYLMDSLLCNNQSRSKNNSILLNRFEAIQQLHKEYDDKLQHDSLLLRVERQLLEGQTNSMLNAHLNKIEHEYSNITLWAAVLTILFLVFSFYSIFKMDELVQQGSVGLRDIRRLKEKGEEDLTSIIKRGEESLKDSKSQLSSFIDVQQQIVSSTIDEISKSKSQIDQKYGDEIIARVNLLDSYIKLVQKFLEEKGIVEQDLDGREENHG